MADEVEEIMARAIDPHAFKRRDDCWPMEHLNSFAAATAASDRRRISKAQKNVRAAIAALHAHGYKITKDDPDMMVIKEIETRGGGERQGEPAPLVIALTRP